MKFLKVHFKKNYEKLIILIISTYYILCVSWIIKCLIITDARCKMKFGQILCPPFLSYSERIEASICSENICLQADKLIWGGGKYVDNVTLIPKYENSHNVALRSPRCVMFHCVELLWRMEKVYYRRADKSLARPGRKQARKHVRDARDFNNIETRAVKFFFLC